MTGIAVRQLVSTIQLAGTARACQRKPPEESSVGWLSRTSRRKNIIAICDFIFLLLFHLQLSRISSFFASVSARAAAFQNCFQNGLGRSNEFFRSETKNYRNTAPKPSDCFTTQVTRVLTSTFEIPSKYRPLLTHNSQHTRHLLNAVRLYSL